MSDDPRLEPVSDELAESIGLLHLAWAIGDDQELMPHNSEEARSDVAEGLRLLEAVRCRGFVLVPREPNYALMRELQGSFAVNVGEMRERWHNLLDVAEDWRDEYPETDGNERNR